MNNRSSFFTELKRRNVVRVAGLYLVGAWLLTQVASTLLPAFDVASWALRALIVTLAIGFIPAVIFSWVFELTPEGLKRDEDVAPGRSITPQTGRRMDRMMIVVLALALGYFAFDKFVLAPRREAALAVRGAPNESKSVISEKSIAVLPLMNSTGDPANEYFSDGMSEEFISTLSRLQDLKVIGRTSSFQFKGKTDDSKTIGEKLGVYYLLEGSVRKSADRVRIAVALVKAGDGANVWSETYDRELKDIFAVQSEIAGAVAKQLKVALLGKQRAGRAVGHGGHAFEPEYRSLQRTLAGKFLQQSQHGRRYAQGDRLLRGGDPARPSLCARLRQAVGRGEKSDHGLRLDCD